MTAPATRRCEACDEADLVTFADLGATPVRCGQHWADRGAALASPAGAVRLASCPRCGYVRNVAFDPALMVYDTTIDYDLHHSAAFRAFTTELVAHLADRLPLAGARVLDIGCAQGEFLRQLCGRAGCTGIGYDATYAGPTGPDPSGAEFHSRLAPRGDALPRFDVFTCRHWLEHLHDPHEFLVDLRRSAHGREVTGYLEVPDGGYDLATAGWQIIYPHVSYFDGYAVCQILTRAGWRVEGTGTFFSGMLRWVEVSANRPPVPVGAGPALPGRADRDRQLAAIGGFTARYTAERGRWRDGIAGMAAGGARPVLWGAGSRSVQFLAAVDPDRRLSAVVDVNPRKWGRYLPGGGHRVDPPEVLARLQPRAVIITNPAYRDEIAKSLVDLGVSAELHVA